MNALGLNALASNHLFSRMHMAVLHLWLVFVCIWSYRHLQGVVDRYRSMHSFGCLTLNVINQSIIEITTALVSQAYVCVNYKSGSPGPRKGPQSTQESSEEH